MTSMTNTVTKAFGAGNLFAIPTTTAGVALTPVQVGILQDVEIDISGAVAELYGQNQFPVAAARGKGKISGKAKVGQFDINLFNSLYWGGTVTSPNYTKVYTNEAQTAGASLPTIVPTNIGSSNITDLGIYYSTTGVQLTLSTAAAPTIGNYSVLSSGLYTVSTAETAATAFLINYNSLSSASGNSLTITNQLMGIQPVFKLQLWEGYTDITGRTNFDLQLNRCISTKLTFPFKNTDFMTHDFEFTCFADSAGNVCTLGVGA